MNAVEQQLSTCSDTCMYDHFILHCLLLEQGKYKDYSKTPTGGGYSIWVRNYGDTVNLRKKIMMGTGDLSIYSKSIIFTKNVKWSF